MSSGFEFNWNDLAPEEQAKARDCKTPEDILAFAKEAGYELTDEQLEAVAGGDSWSGCPGVCFMVDLK